MRYMPRIQYWLQLTLAFTVGVFLTAMAFAYALEGTRWNPKEVVMPTITYYKQICNDRIVPIIPSDTVGY